MCKCLFDMAALFDRKLHYMKPYWDKKFFVENKARKEVLGVEELIPVE